MLLISIGTAQALVMPAGTPRAYAWVWWTALGWFAGLIAFTMVAPPLWREGQVPVAIALIGVAAGAVMAIVMAAVTGVGVMRLCADAQVRHGPDPNTLDPCGVNQEEHDPREYDENPAAPRTHPST